MKEFLKEESLADHNLDKSNVENNYDWRYIRNVIDFIKEYLKNPLKNGTYEIEHSE